MRQGSLAGRLSRSAALGVLATVASVPAFAQETTTPATVETVQPAEPPAEETEDRVVITGSRLQSSSFTSASPMTVITAEQADLEGIADVASLLQSATVAAGSSQVTAATSLQFVTNGGTGTETLSLRGLGATRTLILLDGRRAGPAGTRGSVGPFDLNVIPLSAIERVEVLKDGASSLYGSDAIAGVVNIITKKGSGAEANLFYNAPLDGGGEELRASASWGEDFGNLRFRVTGDYYKREELARGDRDFFSCGENYVFNPDGSRADLVDPRTDKYICASDLVWGHNWVYDYTAPGNYSGPWQAPQNLIQFDRGGNMAPYLPAPIPLSSGLVMPAGWYPVGYEELLRPGATNDPYYTQYARNSRAITDYKHPFQDQASVIPETERMTVMASGEWDINDGLTAYAEVLLNRRTNKVNGYRQFWTYQYLLTYGYGYTYGDPIAKSLGWDLLQDGVHFVGLSPTAITDHNDEEVSIDYTRFVAGLRGDVWEMPGWSWEISTQFSRSSGDYTQDIIWNDAIADQWFRSSSCVGTTTSYRGVPCVDVTWYTPEFLGGDIPANEAAFLFGTVKGNTVFEQISTEAYVTGDLFELPAGPVGAVFGLFYQDDRINDVPSQAMQDGELWGDSQAGITTGNDDTRAAFVEFGIPVLKDMPLAQSVDLSLSARYTDVASYGGEDTWKAGLNWQITPEFRVRASQGTSFRSPSLFELYLSGETSFARQSIDPCVAWANNLALGNITQRIADNCAAEGIGPTQLSGGGATMSVLSNGGKGILSAETAESRSLGFIWQPDFIDFQMSVDYFDIQVNGEVSKLGAASILRGCYDSPSFPTDPLCSLFVRNPSTPGTPGAGLIATLRNDFINIASQGNRGIDIEARYRHELPWGDLIVDLQASRQLEDSFQLLPTSPAQEFNGENGDPVWVGNLNFTFDSGPFSAFWGVRYVDATSNVEPFVEANGTNWTFLYEPADYKLSTPPMFYHNASVAYEFPGDVTGRLGVTNIFDEQPPIVSSNAGYARLGNAVIESQYDLLGRTVFVNLTKKF